MGAGSNLQLGPPAPARISNRVHECARRVYIEIFVARAKLTRRQLGANQRGPSTASSSWGGPMQRHLIEELPGGISIRIWIAIEKLYLRARVGVFIN